MTVPRIGSMVNGVTYIMNLLSLLGAYGCEVNKSNASYDYNLDGIIGSADLLVMLAGFPYG